MEEYLDIVDENGNPTGEKELRSVVHEKGLRHRTSHIYFYRVRNNKIEVLAHLRSKQKDSFPNRWITYFGGHVSSGQTLEDSIESEIMDEIGIKMTPANITTGFIYSYNSEKNKEHISIFYYKTSENEKYSFNDGEVCEIKWMNEDGVIKSMHDNPEIWVGREITFKQVMEDLKSKI